MKKNLFQKFLDGEIMIQVKTNDEYEKLINYLKKSNCINKDSEIIYPYYFSEDSRVNFVAITRKSESILRNYKIINFDKIAENLSKN